MKVASVVLDIPTRALDVPYTYLVPEDVCDGFPVEVGCAVLVSFGHRHAVGFVVSVAEYSEDDFIKAGLDPTRLKALERLLSHSYFDEEALACAQWLSRYYIAPLSSCVRLFTPPGGVARMVRTSQGRWRLEKPTVGEVDDRWVVPAEAFSTYVPRKNAVKQAAIIEALRLGELRVAELSVEFGSVTPTLKTLEEKGVVRIEHRRRMRIFSPDVHEANTCAETLSSHVEDLPLSFIPSPKPCLTQEQTRALDIIKGACERRLGEVVLVDGVTGSGKTEVYLQAIEAVLARGRTACVLVPEISLTPQTLSRFRGRFGDAVGIMHSRMSQGERFDQWDFIRSGKARVVVGARSALFTPLSNVGLIVIDEEHESSYKQDAAPRYHARDVAVWMAKRSGACVVLGSATPSIEALYACAKNPAWHHVVLGQRVNGKPLPQVNVIDMAAEFNSGSRSMFSRDLSRALIEELSACHKAVLLLNQRGFAKFVLCRKCGHVPMCPSCSCALTYHEQGGFLMCHHCGYRVAMPVLCPVCSSPYLKKFGAGTQRVEAELRVLLDAECGTDPGIPIIRMDADTTSKKGSHQRLLEQFAASDAAVLLGTQMIAKGLDFKDVSVVGVINADTMLNLPDYRAGERTFDLVEQVAGRAGRGGVAGRVFVQTYAATSVSIRAAATYDRALFLHDELPKRRLLGYPPYVRMVNVLLWGKNEAAVREYAEELYGNLVCHLRDFAGVGWEVLPATPCALERLRAAWRWHIVIKCPTDADISDVLLKFFRDRRINREVNVAIDVDPYDML